MIRLHKQQEKEGRRRGSLIGVTGVVPPEMRLVDISLDVVPVDSLVDTLPLVVVRVITLTSTTAVGLPVLEGSPTQGGARD